MTHCNKWLSDSFLPSAKKIDRDLTQPCHRSKYVLLHSISTFTSGLAVLSPSSFILFSNVWTFAKSVFSCRCLDPIPSTVADGTDLEFEAATPARINARNTNTLQTFCNLQLKTGFATRVTSWIVSLDHNLVFQYGGGGNTHSGMTPLQTQTL